jgi:mono/diheme cytochrome c family protein
LLDLDALSFSKLQAGCTMISASRIWASFRPRKAPLLLALAAASACFTANTPAAEIDFARDVRPILERSCFACHGPKKQKSGYRLDVRETAIRGGESGDAAIVPHSAKKSPLIRFISGEDEDMLMPPKKSDQPRLSAQEIATLRAWVDGGPVWPDEFAGAQTDSQPHWSLRPLAKLAAPTGEANPIDGFIHAKLAEKHLAPAPPAEKRTLLRRVYYDLTGLPPTPEETAAFVADTAPDAYDKVVDRLLASPRYGEHWARHWLDVAHYADTHGNDHDYARPNAWPYRDYIIRAFNEDKSYARFVQEQVAGDALFPEDPRAIAALGFLAAGPWDHTLMVGVREDTVDHRNAQNLDRDDMVTTVMSTFQSLTVHCARCHNHKFDPISQRDYYSLQAVFAGVDRADRPFDADPATYARRAELLARKAALERRDPALLATLATPEIRAKIVTAGDALAHRNDLWTPLEAVSVTSATGAETAFARQADGSWFVSGTRPDKDTFIVTAQTTAKDIRALRLEALPDASLPGKGPGRYAPSGNFHLTEFRVDAQPSRGTNTGAKRLQFSGASADHSDGGDNIANAIDGRPDTHWSIHPRYGDPHEAVFELAEPLGNDGPTTLIIRLEQNGTAGHQLGRFRISLGTGAIPENQRAPLPATTAELLRKPEASRTLKEQQQLTLQVLIGEIERELARLPAPKMVYAVTRDFPVNGSFKPSPSPRPIHLLTRGDLAKPAELIGPGALGCLPGLSRDLVITDPANEASRRAALACWLTDPQNALTWRSIVNRVWHYHFGHGLCSSPNDFGKMGATPSHPELLDWLAVWFRDDAHGSLKALHRLIITSATYRQGVAQNLATAGDSDNRLLGHMNRRRLTAEQIRDSLLQFSGQIDLTMGGPSVVQFIHRGQATFQPDGGAPAFLDYENFPPDSPENRRRAVYRFLFRTVPDPLMDALDAPDGSTLTPLRNVSTTAVQAFALLNNPFVIRQCEHIAERLTNTTAAPDQQIAAAFQLILLRAPTVAERATFTAYSAKHGLANAVQLLINSNEFIHLD